MNRVTQHGPRGCVLRWVAIVAALSLSIANAPAALAVDAPLKEDRIRFIIHDLVAGQMTAADLGGYLDTVHDYFQGSQNTSIDIPTCTDIGTVTDGGPQPHLYTSNGGLANNLAVIDDETELFAVLDWGATQGTRVAIFVQDIRWCGAVLPNTIGCAPTPGNVFVVSLTASQNVRGMVIGHERGHNGGLSHRSDDSCALMFPSAASTHGCLNQTEAKALYDQANISTGDTCECINVQFQGPSQTWSLNPQGTSCDDNDVCSSTSTCDTGLCAGAAPIDCDDADVCTDNDCDPVTGCFNPPSADLTPCFDLDTCNGFEFCFSGVCTPGQPLVCDDAVYCNGLEACDPIDGCGPGTPPDVDDQIACTIDSCDEPTDSIVHTPDDGACANGAFCDGDEICNAQTGCISGAAPPLDDGVACTDDACDEGADLIVHVPNPALCDDGNICTAESCDEFLGCSSDPILDCVGPEVPSLSIRGLAALVGLMYAVGSAALARRQRFSRARIRG